MRLNPEYEDWLLDEDVAREDELECLRAAVAKLDRLCLECGEIHPPADIEVVSCVDDVATMKWACVACSAWGVMLTPST